MTSVFAKKMRLHSGDFGFQNVFGRNICWKSPPRSGILYANTKEMHRPRSDSPQHFDIETCTVMDEH